MTPHPAPRKSEWVRAGSPAAAIGCLPPDEDPQGDEQELDGELDDFDPTANFLDPDQIEECDEAEPESGDFWLEPDDFEDS